WGVVGGGSTLGGTSPPRPAPPWVANGISGTGVRCASCLRRLPTPTRRRSAALRDLERRDREAPWRRLRAVGQRRKPVWRRLRVVGQRRKPVWRRLRAVGQRRKPVWQRRKPVWQRRKAPWQGPAMSVARPGDECGKARR